MIVIYDQTVITIVNYGRKTLIVKATGDSGVLAYWPRFNLGQKTVDNTDIAVKGSLKRCDSLNQNHVAEQFGLWSLSVYEPLLSTF